MKKLAKGVPFSVAGNADFNDGLVYVGKKPMTDKHVEALMAFLVATNGYTGPVPPIDPLSVVGRWHPDWSSAYEEASDGEPYGGLGSPVYETQKVGTGVKFTEADKPIWYREKIGGEFLPHDGMVKGVPPNYGAYHTHDFGDGMTTENREGPKPGSQAERRLGDGEYSFDGENGWYIVV